MAPPISGWPAGAQKGGAGAKTRGQGGGGGGEKASSRRKEQHPGGSGGARQWMERKGHGGWRDAHTCEPCMHAESNTDDGEHGPTPESWPWGLNLLLKWRAPNTCSEGMPPQVPGECPGCGQLQEFL